MYLAIVLCRTPRLIIATYFVLQEIASSKGNTLQAYWPKACTMVEWLRLDAVDSCEALILDPDSFLRFFKDLETNTALQMRVKGMIPKFIGCKVKRGAWPSLHANK